MLILDDFRMAYALMRLLHLRIAVIKSGLDECPLRQAVANLYKWFIGLWEKMPTFVHYNVHKYTCFMVIISSAELRNNMKKYLDIAKNEKVVIQRGRNETFVLVAQNNAAEEDLNRAITVDDVLARVREGLNEMFERKEGHNIA